MTSQYRVKNTGGCCYPQVRFKTFFGWSDWQRIAKHSSGWGLYNTDEYPRDFYSCEEIINKYHKDEGHTTYGFVVPTKTLNQ